MEGDLSTALSLLAIGMITVFIVLFLVVVTGKRLIRLVNKLNFSENGDAITPSKIAAITSAVEVYTEGKGKITKIERQQ